MIIAEFPDHFADLLFNRTKGHQQKGQVVWNNPETGSEFDDIHIEIICRYLRVAYRMDDHLYFSIPHAHFLMKYERFCISRQLRLQKIGQEQDAERFFALPDAIASEDCVQRWGELPYLTSDECAALALGYDPDIVSLTKVELAVGDRQSAFLKKYRDIKHMFESHQSIESKHSKIPRALYRKLLPQSGSDRREMMIAVNRQRTDQNASEAKEVSAPAVHSLYRIVLAVVINQYPGVLDYFEEENKTGFVRREPTGSVFTQMEKELRQIIPSINAKNVREYLRRAYRHAKKKRLLPEGERLPVEKIPEK